MRTKIVAFVLGIGLGLTFPAFAGRSSTGTYSLPSGTPFVPGTVISSSVMNNVHSDIASALTDSLSRTGKGPMSAPLQGVDGTAAAPSFSFATSPGSGMYLSAPAEVAISAGGTQAAKATAGGLDVPAGVTAAALRARVVGGSNTVSLLSPDTLAASFSMKLPTALPASGTRPLAITSAGQVEVGEASPQVSSISCSTFTTTSATLVDVTNLSVTITTHGRPVMLFFQPDGSPSQMYVTVPAAQTAKIHIMRGATTAGAWQLYNTGGGTMGFPPGGVMLDAPSAGTYTYKVQASVTGGGTLGIQYAKLIAVEI
ncbi:hypothetical protein [Anaeromyxobacter dehalogenans]|uniref:Uncharacterized protein n=1 Tax=Anaeromyxobacter dehalogenans (strain 2CP-C) TaxID=290397 RepID=Q2IJ20_ANADE|nr:hypothetical protein [Anaeromyxobacter dehalogenans]ABC81648.1 hypothetical protein Adeh_1877 [Anaeromyxobacter dehalogenans 2CP-C]